MEKKNQESIFTRLFLIRHGLTEWNTKRKIQGTIDTHLNQEGIQQAIALSQRLVNLYPIDQIYASPSNRALKTAELINEKYKVNLQIDSDLLEIDFGNLANHSIDSLDIEQPEYHQKFTHFISTNREKGTPRPERTTHCSSLPRRINQMSDYIFFRCISGKFHAILGR